MENRSVDYYEEKKLLLIKQLTERQQNHIPIRLQKETSNLFRDRKNDKPSIDVKHFNQVINIDRENLIADVEGMITYEALVDECLKYHCLPMVVPELKTITIGGALSGGGIESSSFQFGLVHETILEFEVLLSDANVVLCRPDNEHSDLFYGFPNTFGTLGYALRIKLKLSPTKPFVKLKHSIFTEPKLFFSAMQFECFKNRKNVQYHFIEGVHFHSEKLVLTTGEFVDNAPYKSDYTFMNIYYQSLLSKKEDYLSIRDYIWRWDTDWFWCSKFFFLQSPLLRLLAGKKRLNSKTYWKIRHFFGNNALAKCIRELFSKRSEAVIQDVQIPIDKANEFLSFFQKEIGITPIWLCPTMPYQKEAVYTFYPMNPDTLYVNFGFWDIVSSKKEEGYYNRLIENKVLELGGFKSLYSDVYYTKETFWTIFNQNRYDALKKRYDNKNGFRSLYQKCVEK